MDAVMGSPGTPKRIEVMSPAVAVPAVLPRRKEKGSTGLIVKIKGSIRARVTGPPRPGRIPTEKPMAIPANWRANAFHVKSWVKPWRQASRISTIAEFQRGTRQPPRPRRRWTAGRRYDLLFPPGIKSLFNLDLN